MTTHSTGAGRHVVGLQGTRRARGCDRRGSHRVRIPRGGRRGAQGSGERRCLDGAHLRDSLSAHPRRRRPRGQAHRRRNRQAHRQRRGPYRLRRGLQGERRGVQVDDTDLVQHPARKVRVQARQRRAMRPGAAHGQRGHGVRGATRARPACHAPRHRRQQQHHLRHDRNRPGPRARRGETEDADSAHAGPR